MDKIFAVILILLSLLCETLPAGAQNPFLTKENSQQVSPTPAPPNPYIAKIIIWQQKLNQKMTVLTRRAKETGSLRPLLTLIIIAFVYGFIHALGPGHGKAVAASYLISYGRKLTGGIVIGNLIALFHGLSGVALVLAVHFVLKIGVSRPLASMTRTTQLVSYSLIVLFGAGLLIRSLILWHRRKRSENADSDISIFKTHRYPLAIALTVGMVPCPGVVLIMLFCLSLNLIGLGMLLAFSVSLGMAVTISAVGVATLVGKSLALGALERRRSLAETIERILATTAALIVMTLGLVFLSATL
jgi:ABC-type nickel/cobalt efflux system permease component RcnA